MSKEEKDKRLAELDAQIEAIHERQSQLQREIDELDGKLKLLYSEVIAIE